MLIYAYPPQSTQQKHKMLYFNKISSKFSIIRPVISLTGMK